MLNKWTVAPSFVPLSISLRVLLQFLPVLEHVLFFLLFDLRVSKKGTDLLVLLA